MWITESIHIVSLGKSNLQSETFLSTVNQALRSLSRSEPIEALQWMTLNIIQNVVQDAQGKIPIDSDDISWAVRTVLEDGISKLAQLNSDDAKLLRLRFMDGCTVQDVAERLDRSESNIFYRQRKAIKKLADLLIAQEQQAQSEQTIKTTARYRHIPSIVHGPLFGLDQKVARIQKIVFSKDYPWIVNIVGMGGIGKTTLAQSVASLAAKSGTFEDVVWVTVKLEEFNTWSGQIQPSEDTISNVSDNFRLDAQSIANAEVNSQLDNQIENQEYNVTSVTYDALLDTIAQQLGMSYLPNAGNIDSIQPEEIPSTTQTYAKQEAVRTFLNKHPALIIIDNLETLADANRLVDYCRPLTKPSKLILTSRHQVQTDDAYHINIEELSKEDSISLLRAETMQRGLRTIVNAESESLESLYELVGGNPLAIKLVAGQLSVLSLNEVSNGLQNVNEIQRAEYSMYYYLYWQTWQLLSPQAKDVLLSMIVVPSEGCTLDNLVTVSESEKSQVIAALHELTTLSMINVAGGVEKTYTIHRLTRTFLMTDILEWW